jgi:hypothetical protein
MLDEILRDVQNELASKDFKTVLLTEPLDGLTFLRFYAIKKGLNFGYIREYSPKGKPVSPVDFSAKEEVYISAGNYQKIKSLTKTLIKEGIEIVLSINSPADRDLIGLRELRDYAKATIKRPRSDKITGTLIAETSTNSFGPIKTVISEFSENEDFLV